MAYLVWARFGQTASPGIATLEVTAAVKSEDRVKSEAQHTQQSFAKSFAKPLRRREATSCLLESGIWNLESCSFFFAFEVI